MNKPFDIVLMVGIPGSGKTTFCRERLFPLHLYISLDQLRTRSAEAELFAFALKRHKPCVIDNTNVTAAERRRYSLRATSHIATFEVAGKRHPATGETSVIPVRRRDGGFLCGRDGARPSRGGSAGRLAPPAALLPLLTMA